MSKISTTIASIYILSVLTGCTGSNVDVQNGNNQDTPNLSLSSPELNPDFSYNYLEEKELWLVGCSYVKSSNVAYFSTVSMQFKDSHVRVSGSDATNYFKYSKNALGNLQVEDDSGMIDMMLRPIGGRYYINRSPRGGGNSEMLSFYSSKHEANFYINEAKNLSKIKNTCALD